MAEGYGTRYFVVFKNAGRYPVSEYPLVWQASLNVISSKPVLH